MRGSSASALASAARLTMPPESSEGNLMPLSADKPASASFIAAILSCCSRGRSVCSRIGSIMFCATESDENNAPCWNSTPMSEAFSAGPTVSMRLPFKRTWPAFGRCSPVRVLSRTDLPDPDPPAMPMISPGRMSRLTLSCTTCLPKRLTMPRAERSGSPCFCFRALICRASRTGWKTMHRARSPQRSP